MSRDALLDLLRDRIGLDAGSLGERIVDDACAEARRTLHVADDTQLVQRMRADPAAFAAAAEHFLVGESWFFRADEQFADLVAYARANRDRRPLRVLSLPCASGEEAHSAVIRLLEAGLSPGEIEVLGIDLSEPAVLRARAGRYRASALRGQAPVSPWMHPADDGGGGFVVDDLVRQCVHFRVGNALDDAHLRGADRFDVVFCRNLLIYLDPAARKRLLGQLRALLAAPGLLLAGQAEVVSTMHPDFLPVPSGSPLSFRLRASGDDAPAAPLARPPIQMPATLNRRSAAAATAVAKPAPAPVAPPPPVDVLAQARALADAGRLADALASCTRWLDVHPADSEALFLLGLLESARGHFDAADQAFTRVLYVDRDHADALAQRIGLAERFGRTAQARDLRARAARLRARQASP